MDYFELFKDPHTVGPTQRLATMSVDSGNDEIQPPRSGTRLFDASRALVSGGHFTQSSRDSANNIVHNHYYTTGLGAENIFQREDAASQSGDPTVRVLSPTAPRFMPSPSHVGLRVERSNQIYERHMLCKARGYPLWIPECSMNLHVDKRRLGVAVGDVGIVTTAGGFSFLFNILLPIDHPIQPRRMPEGYTPAPPIDSDDMMTVEDLHNNSCLTSISVRRLEVEQPATSPSSVTEQVFEMSSSEGAVLALPEGAISFDMENLRAWKMYMAAHIEDWYKHVNGRLGREAENGDIRLVVGVDKTSSWGMAVAGAGQQALNTQPSRLRFRSSADDRSPVKHKWDCTGVVETRAGPRVDVIQQLFQSGGTSQDTPIMQNQCIFIRTLNATLCEDSWAGLSSQFETVFNENQRPSISSPSRNSSDGSTNKSRSTSSGYSHIASWTGSNSYANDIIEVPNMFGKLYVENHPGSVLNQLLLKISPNARVAITSDHDWCRVQYDESNGFDSVEAACRALSQPKHYIVHLEDGIVQIQRQPTKASGSQIEPPQPSPAIVPLHMDQKDITQGPTLENTRIRSIQEAHQVIYAVLTGRLPFAKRELNADERKNIKAGDVYIWEEPRSQAMSSHTMWRDSMQWGLSRRSSPLNPALPEDGFIYYERRVWPTTADLTDMLSSEQAAMLAPSNCQPLIKQSYYAYTFDVPSTGIRGKWYMIAYWTAKEVETLGTIEHIQGVGDLQVPEGCFKTGRLRRPPRPMNGQGSRTPKPTKHPPAPPPTPPHQLQLPLAFRPYQHESFRNLPTGQDQVPSF